MIRHNLDDFVLTSQRLLLLQGSLGSFFFELGQWLIQQKKTVYKINFNGGDAFFYPQNTPNTFNYCEHFDFFDRYLIQFCQRHQIDAIVVFGDNRPCHKIAKQVAQQLGIHFWVFEEGYFRPHYVTLEKKGVNAYSPLPRHKHFFLEAAKQCVEPEIPKPLAKGFLPMAKRAIYYYWQTHKFRSRYKDYRHHRILDLRYYVKLWASSARKRICYWLKERFFEYQVKAGKLGTFFIIPLQVYDDSQVSEHSDHKSVRLFLEDVLTSFAHYAPREYNLVVKHHPMDRGFTDYRTTIDEMIAQYPQLKGRIFYIHDVPLPVFLRTARGMVTLNSTSGLSALLHDMPVKTLGRANYDFEGLTHQGHLAEFWCNPQAPETAVFEAYRRFHLNKTQINGSFYHRVALRFPYNQSK